MVYVYTQPNCVQCRFTKRHLEKFNLDFEERDLSDYPEIVEKAKSKGFMSAPIVTAGEIMFSGFQPDKIRKLAKD